MPDPTIIIGSLNNQELKRNIDDLVNAVENGTNKMKTMFDGTIEGIKQKLQELGQVKKDIVGADGGSTQRAAKQEKEKKAVEQTTNSYQNMAAAIQNAVSASSAKNSMYNILDLLTQKAASARQEMQRMNDISWERSISRWKAWQDEIDASKQKIAQLNERLQNTSNPNAKKGIVGLLQEEQKHIEYLRGMQAFAVNRQIQLTQQEAAAKKQAYDQARQQINELIGKQRESANATSTQTQRARELTNEIKQQATAEKEYSTAIQQSAEALRRHFMQNKTNKIDVGNNKFIYADSEAASIERQLEVMAAHRTKEFDMQATIVKAIAEDEKRITTEIERQGQKLKKYEKPQTYNFDVQRSNIENAIKQKLGENTIVAKWDEQTSSIKKLEAALKQYRAAYSQMNDLERNSPFGTQMKADMQLLERRIKQLRQEMAKPLTFETIKNLPQNTIDRLVEKIKLLRSYKGSIDITKPNADAELAKVNNELTKLETKLKQLNKQKLNFDELKNLPTNTINDMLEKLKALQQYRNGINIVTPEGKRHIRDVDNEIKNLNKDLQQFTQNTKKASDMANALGRSWNYMKNRLAFYFTVGASTQFVKNLIEVRSQYEMNERALGILIGSAEYGSKVFQELSNMALVSPYTLIELSTAAKQLTAYDIAAKDVVDTTRRLADMAAAVGVPIERLTYALGQIKAYEYLNSRDARMFLNAGIPLVKELAEHYSELEGKVISVGDVYDMIKKKAIGFEDVMAVIYKMTDEGGRFYDFQAKMADTLKVRLANLTLAWNNMLNDIGKSNQGVLVNIINLLKNIFLHWEQINRAIKSALWTAGIIVGFRVLNAILIRTGLQWRILNKQIGFTAALGSRATNALRNLGTTFKSLIHSGTFWASVITFAIVSIISDINAANDKVKEFNNNIREGAKTTYDDIKKFLEQDYIKDIRDKLYEIKSIQLPERETNLGGGVTSYQAGNTVDVLSPTKESIPTADATKAWEALREQIKLSSASSEVFVSRLLQISDINERLRQGFFLVEKLQEVKAGLKDINDETFAVSKNWSAWWNAGQLPDGLVQNLEDYTEKVKFLNDNANILGETWEEGKQKLEEYNNSSDGLLAVLDDNDHDVKVLKSDVEDLTESVLNYINLKGYQNDPDKINEVFSTAVNQVSLDYNLTPDQAFELQLQVAEAKAAAEKQALEKRLADEQAAIELATDLETKSALDKNIKKHQEELANFEDYCGRGGAIWQEFTKWMSDEHINEVREKFRNIEADEIDHLDFTKGAWYDWATKTAWKFAREHKLSYNDAFGYLMKWVQKANLWEIFIKLTISTEGGGSVVDGLKKLDQQIDALDTDIERRQKRIDDLVNKGDSLTQDEANQLGLLRAEQKADEQAKKEAIAKGGRSKKDDREAEKQRKADERESRKRNRAAAAAAKRERAAAERAQRQAETELQKTLKNELQLIDKIRSAYEALVKEGKAPADAIDFAVTGYDTAIGTINEVLKKWDLPEFHPEDFTGLSNPHKLMAFLNNQLDLLVKSGKAKPAEIQDLQVKVNSLELDAEKYDLKKIKEGLDDNLNRLSEGYELALELDENPELGNALADMLGFDAASLPHDIEDYADRVFNLLGRYLDEVGEINLDFDSIFLTDDDLKAYHDLVKEEKLSESVYETIKKAVLDVREKKKKDVTETMNEWQKLLDKYAEYEQKCTEITRQAEKERETARKAHAPQYILDAIDKKERQELAKADFEEFQKSQIWIQATGDLATYSDKAISLFIERLQEYKKNSKNLDPKQIQKINRALKQLYKQQRSGNPFHLIGDAIAEAKERMDDIQIEIDETVNEINRLKHKQWNGEILSDKELEKLDKLIKRNKELRDIQFNANVTPEEIVEGLNAVVEVANQASEAFSEMAEAAGGKGMTDAAQNLQKIVGVLQDVGSFALIGAQVGGQYGAIIGAVAGLAKGVVTQFADEISGNKKINNRIEHSELAVKRLELAYIDLDNAMNKAYGNGIIGAQKLAAENKKAQLAEMKHQLQLEKSRKAKNRDQDTIIELQKNIRDLEYEISDMVDEVVNSLLGISSVGDAMESLMDNFVEALRSGENAMDTFNESINDMIANMVKKMFTTKILQPWFEEQWGIIQNEIDKRGSEYYDEYEKLLKQRADLDNIGNVETAFFEQLYGKTLEEYSSELDNRIEELKNLIYQSGGVGVEDIRKYAELLRSGAPIMEENMAEIRELLISLGLMKDSANSNLSALQQGIQGITEDTAGALEAYMNSVSQQVYLHSDILTQIRDTLVSFNNDVQVATIGQILLQLQASYQVQMTIQNTLDGWSSPNGQSIRVEMI